MSNLFDGYPASVGGRRISVVQHYGPSAYVVVTRAATPSGGDTLQASEFGFKYIDAVIGVGLSDDGTYIVIPLSGSNPTDGVRPVPVTSLILDWLDLVGATEVTVGTNLSGRCVTIAAIGI